jgi:hypothetical protein
MSSSFIVYATLAFAAACALRRIHPEDAFTRLHYGARTSAILAATVLAYALVVRVPFLCAAPVVGLTNEVESVAISLSEGRGWSDPYHLPTGPTAHVTPIYPACLAVLYRTFGTCETMAGFRAQGCFSLTLAMLTLLLLPVVAAKLRLPAAVGWSAALLCAWLPMHRADEVIGRQDQVAFAPALLGLVWALADLRDRSWSPGRALALGLPLGLGVLLAPNLLAVLLLHFALEFAFGVGARRKVLRSAAVVLACVLAMTMPWIVRNYAVFGEFVPLRSNFGLELALGNRPGAAGNTYDPGFDDIHPWGNDAVRGHLAEIGEAAFMREKKEQALAWIAAHPAEFLRLTARRIYLFWFTPSLCWFHFKAWIPVPLCQLMGVAILLEFVRLGRSQPRVARLLFCAIVGVGLPYFVTHVEGRYRTPVIGLVALLSCSWTIASVRWAWLSVRLAASRNAGAAGAAAASAAAAAGSSRGVA